MDDVTMRFGGKWTISLMMVFMVVLSAMAPLSVSAELLELSRVVPFQNLASQQELRERYVNLSTVPYGRDDLAIQLMIPKEWRDIPIRFPAEKLQQASEIFIPLTEQRAPKGEPGNALIEVRYSKLDLEMALSDLVDVFLESGEYEVLMRRSAEYNRREVDEALIRTVQEDGVYLARLTYSRHGDRIFLVNASVKEDRIEQYAKIFGIAAVSFTVKQKSTSKFAQPMTRFSSAAKPRLRFRYPSTDWRVQELEGRQSGVTAVNLTLQVVDEVPEQSQTYALIYVEAVSRQSGISPKQLLGYIKATFEQSDFIFGSRVLTADLEPSMNAPLGKLERWAATVGGTPVEVSLLVLPKGDTYLGVGLFTMRRADNRFAWMTSWRVFEIVVEDLSGKSQSFASVRKLAIPSDEELNRLMGQTMGDFSLAVNNKDFSQFHLTMAQRFQNQFTPNQLYNSFRNFSGKGLVPAAYRHSSPTLTSPPYIRRDGELKLIGFYPTQPLITQFELSYVNENSVWKLQGLKVYMAEKPAATLPADADS
ncbi:MAG: hypothetical protein ABW080_04515 [Candidatus Thiodiazotropha sp.]